MRSLSIHHLPKGLRRTVAALSAVALSGVLLVWAVPGPAGAAPAEPHAPTPVVRHAAQPETDASAVPARVWPLAGATTHRALPGGRTYWLTPGTNGALVVGLPGTDNTATTLNAQFWSGTGGWQAHAQSTGYTLALAETVQGKWNVGGGWPSSGQDDMQYLLDLVADVRAQLPGINPDRVYVAGFSAGGAMAWTAVSLHPEVFAACASASGWAGVHPTAPIDCWHVHGTGDTGVPVRGGAGIFNFVFPPAADEARLAPRGSRVVLYPTSGGHGVPGWMAAQAWSFFAVDHQRP